MSLGTVQSSRRCTTGTAIRSVGFLGDTSIGTERSAPKSAPIARASKGERLQVTICSWCDPHPPEKTRRRRGVRVNYGICPDCLEEKLLRLAETAVARRPVESDGSDFARVTGAAPAG